MLIGGIQTAIGDDVRHNWKNMIRDDAEIQVHYIPFPSLQAEIH